MICRDRDRDPGKIRRGTKTRRTEKRAAEENDAEFRASPDITRMNGVSSFARRGPRESLPVVSNNGGQASHAETKRNRWSCLYFEIRFKI